MIVAARRESGLDFWLWLFIKMHDIGKAGPSKPVAGHLEVWSFLGVSFESAKKKGWYMVDNFP